MAVLRLDEVQRRLGFTGPHPIEAGFLTHPRLFVWPSSCFSAHIQDHLESDGRCSSYQPGSVGDVVEVKCTFHRK